MPIPVPVASFKTNLTSKITSSATTIPIDSVLDDAGSSLDGKVVGVVIEKGTDREETAVGTVQASSSSIINCTRGIDPQDGTTARTALQFEHKKKKSVEITAHPYLILAIRAINGTDGIDNTSRPKLDSDVDASLDTQFVTKGELGRTSVAGAVNASETLKGIVEIATSAEALAGTSDTGGTGALLAITPVKLLNARDAHWTTDYTYGATISAGNLLRLDTADGKWKLADATSAANADNTYGIAIDSGVNNDVGKRVALPGSVVTGLTLTVGLQYLSNTPGAMATTAGTYKKFLGLAVTTTTFIFLPGFRAEDISGGNSSVTTAILNEMATFFSATDITGAEAETLTGGESSNATSLHTHWPAWFKVPVAPTASSSIVLNASIMNKNTEMQVTSTPSGDKMFVMKKVEGNGAFTIYRFDRDPATGNYYGVSFVDSGVTFSSSGSCTGGIFAGASFLWICSRNSGDTNLQIRRFNQDLSTETAITVSGTALTSDVSLAAGDDTNVFVRVTGASTVVAKYTISGTTATRGTDINVTETNANSRGFHWDGSFLFYVDSSSNMRLRKHNSSGTLISTLVSNFFDANINTFNTTNPSFNLGGIPVGFVSRGTTSNTLYEVGAYTSSVNGGGESGLIWLEGYGVTKP